MRFTRFVFLALATGMGCGGIAVSPFDGVADDGGILPLVGPDAGARSDAALRDAGKHLDAGRDAERFGADAEIVIGTRCCTASENTSFPPSTNCSGTSLAWAYTPSCDIAVTTLELFATGGRGRIYDSDAAGRPGVLLFDGALPATNLATFMGVEVNPPVLLHAGHKYFLGKSEGICSIASGGVEQEYYGQFASGWDGPYHGHPYTWRMQGDCK